MFDALFWIYFANAIALLLHEIDSAYWKEWELFRLPGGATGFLLLHIPILFAVLYGLVLVSQKAFAGLIFSMLLGAGGIFAFAIHIIFIKKGRPEFKTTTSLTILSAMLLFSILQLLLTFGRL